MSRAIDREADDQRLGLAQGVGDVWLSNQIASSARLVSTHISSIRPQHCLRSLAISAPKRVNIRLSDAARSRSTIENA
jgi:hypothetical protein